MPTESLWRYREYTWTKEKSRYSASGDPSRWDRLVQSLTTEGWKESDPAIFEIGYEDKHAKLGEGNHRLAVARQVGLAKVPVRFFCGRNVHMRFDPGDPERNVRRRTR